MTTDTPSEREPTVAPRLRAARGGRRLASFSVAVEVVTPILGGGSQAREIDEVDVIRTATVRGHLRFWWRALRGHEFASARELSAAEGELWGRAATDAGGRSLVEVRVGLDRAAGIDDSSVDYRTPGAYAVWPARQPPASRRRPGTRFRLTIAAPAELEAGLRDVVRAWLLFGGYGSRTRRGLGSLTAIEADIDWLPRAASRQALTDLFGRDVLYAPGRHVEHTPWLAGASMHVARIEEDGGTAWTKALGWLSDFRQGTGATPGDRAREPGSGRTPSISNWPEADKVRRLTGRTTGHRPRHNATPAWPRAGFGLPIVGRFQTRGRDGTRLEEPDGFTLVWASASEEHDRLASPLIVKALPLAGGQFAPCALWLNRANPDGVVVLQGVDGSGAPFDRLVAPGDQPRLRALDRQDGSLRTAFLEWLLEHHHTTAVAP